uniref:Uncharacterized protein n=1 Tax=Vespula pensylvanica TaxID=30213 RepID=A0A834NEY7_VESPE|nr:hypothetical protein H0235_014503 [Vespula pensylvanica]
MFPRRQISRNLQYFKWISSCYRVESSNKRGSGRWDDDDGGGGGGGSSGDGGGGDTGDGDGGGARACSIEGEERSNNIPRSNYVGNENEEQDIRLR